MAFITLLLSFLWEKNTENQNQTTVMQTLVELQNFINLGNNTCFKGYDLLKASMPLNSGKFFFQMSLCHMKEFYVS